MASQIDEEQANETPAPASPKTSNDTKQANEMPAPASPKTSNDTKQANETPAPASPKTSNDTNNGYFAVHKGKGVNFCIFLCWDDAKEHVDNVDDAEYKVYDSLGEAAAYIRSLKGIETEKSSTNDDTVDASGVAKRNEENPELSAAKSSTKSTASTGASVPQSEVSGCTESTPEASSAESTSSATNKRKAPENAEDARLLVEMAAVSSKGPKKKKRKKKSKSSRTVVEFVKARKRRPTKIWISYFDKLKACYNEKDDKFDIDSSGMKLKNWMNDQQQQYQLYRVGQPSTMFEEKIQLLNGIGFVFDEPNDPTVPKPKIYKTWTKWLNKLKDYQDEHDGSCDIDIKDKENARLRQWVLDQHVEYKRMQDGLTTTMNNEKVTRLEALNFKFKYVSWEERMDQLKAFKQEHGHLSIPQKDPVLGAWIQSIRRQCKLFQDGKPARDINAKRMEDLNGIGFQTKMKKQPILTEEDNQAFDGMIDKLADFKRQHGHCKVTKVLDPVLHNWVVRQRVDYKRIQEGKPSRLTVQRLMKLTDMGFAFRQKESYKTWEERMDQMRQFKADNGHVNIPISHPTLGEFVGRQRVTYRQLVDGLKSAMTEERAQELRDLGFDFQVDNRKDKNNMQKPKTWEERYEELLAFKEEYGHTVVPQHTPGLGSWVHNQRKDYKLMNLGKKSAMGPEKALKLTSIGFVFDVFDAKRRKRNEEASSDEE